MGVPQEALGTSQRASARRQSARLWDRGIRISYVLPKQGLVDVSSLIHSCPSPPTDVPRAETCSI